MVNIDPDWWRKKFGSGRLTGDPLPTVLFPPAASVAPLARRPALTPRPSEVLRQAIETGIGAARSLLPNISLPNADFSGMRLPDISLPVPEARPSPNAPNRRAFEPLLIDPARQSAFQNVVAGSLNNIASQLTGDWTIEEPSWAKFFDPRVSENEFLGRDGNVKTAVAQKASGTPSQSPTPETAAADAEIGSLRPNISNMHPNILRAWDILVNQRGMSPAQAAGVISTMQVEGGDPTLTSPGVGDSGTAFERFQWRGPRAEGRRQFGPQGLSEDLGYFFQELGSTEDRARQALMGAQTPTEAAAAMLHFERPRGYDPERFNPAAVAGWGDRMRGAQRIYEALSGQTLPPLPPEIGAAPTMAEPVGPDWTAVNQYLDQAAPRAAEDLTAENRWRTLAGIAAGVAPVSVTGPGALANVLAGAGAGGLGAVTRGKELERAERERFGEETRRYAATRAEVAASQAESAANLANARNETAFKNAMAQYGIDLKNQENMFGFQQGLYEQNIPKWLGTSGGTAFIQRGGDILPIRASGSDALTGEQLSAELKAPGGPARIMAQRGDIGGLTRQSVADVIKSGVGAQVFGEEAVNAAIDSLPAHLQTPLDDDARAAQAEAVAAQLIAQGALNNTDWLPAARSYSPSAEWLIKLLQGSAPQKSDKNR